MKKPKLEDIRTAARIVSDVLIELKSLTKPDVSLEMLDALAEKRIRAMGGTPYNKGYKPDWAAEPFPQTVCTSINHEVCHGVARDRKLMEGDIVNYDLGVRYKSGCGDAALTVAVGTIDNRKERLMDHALRSLYEGIKVVKAGEKISSIGRAIEKFAEPRGYNIIRDFGGHHIGSEMHEEPHIPNLWEEINDQKFLEEGKVICIEPMITPGRGVIAINAEDKWTAFCRDYQPSAMFEHMVLVTKDGYEILTTHISEPVVR